MKVILSKYKSSEVSEGLGKAIRKKRVTNVVSFICLYLVCSTIYGAGVYFFDNTLSFPVYAVIAAVVGLILATVIVITSRAVNRKEMRFRPVMNEMVEFLRLGELLYEADEIGNDVSLTDKTGEIIIETGIANSGGGPHGNYGVYEPELIDALYLKAWMMAVVKRCGKVTSLDFSVFDEDIDEFLGVSK